MTGRETNRVIVLGMDGLHPPLVERLMAEGKLPAFSRLRETGAFRRLVTSNPSQSPVAWSTLATGCNPGGHGVFDFIRRNPKKYLPELAILKINPKNPFNRRENMFLPVRQGKAFWTTASEAGIPTTVIRWPLTLPPEPVNGRMLSGLGVPDLHGSLARYTLFTTRTITPTEAEELKGTVVHVPSGARKAFVNIPGPERSRLPMEIVVDRETETVTLSVAGQQLSLKPGEWSDGLQLRFRVRIVKKLRAHVHFYLRSITPELTLYLSPLEVDPRDPAYVITHPDGYAAELTEAIGPYHTLGMPEDTNALQDGLFDPEGFLALCDAVSDEREAMFRHELSRFDEGLLAFVFDTSDRIQHAFWATRDPTHPAYDPAFARAWGHVIPKTYERLDRVLAEALETADERTSVIVVSDHGFGSFRRAVHLNTWLVENGFMTLKSNDPEAIEVPLFRSVDWSRTRAYAVGFCSILLNLKGREARGIVSPGEAADNLKRELAARLSSLKDPQSGSDVVAQVYDSAQIYSGPAMDEAPDLVVGFAAGYRASWQTAVGAGSEHVIEDNLESWSGDHIFDPSLVPGIFFSNRPVTADHPQVADIAPTILDALSVPNPPEMEGLSLLTQMRYPQP